MHDFCGNSAVYYAIPKERDKIKKANNELIKEIEKEVQKRVARALAGMKGGLSKARNRKNQNISVSEEEGFC